MSKASYAAAYRKAAPEKYEQQKAFARAENRAHRKLAKKYPRAYEELLRYEYAIEGYELTRCGGPGVPRVKRGLTYKDSQ